MTTKLPSRNYSWSLDLARVIALGLVVLHHSTQPVTNWLEWSIGRKISMLIGHGWIGVDLFFVLSGFLLSTQLIGIADSPQGLRRKTLFNFYSRRILRTWPGYFLILAIIYFALPHVSVALRSQSTYLSDFSWHNLVFLSNYNPPLAALDVSWSLCLEEQFYLLIPVIYLLFGMFGCSKLARIKFLAAMFLAATVARTWTYLQSDSLVPGSYEMFWQFYANLLLHPEGFLAGLFIGEVGLDKFVERKHRKFVVSFLILGCAVIYFLGWNAVSAFSVILLLPFLAIFFQFLIWDLRFWNGERLVPILHFFSKRTYSIYLTHTISNHLLRPYLENWPAFLAWTFGLAAAVATGSLFYLAAEWPFEKLRERLRR